MIPSIQFFVIEQRIYMYYKNKLIESSSVKVNRTIYKTKIMLLIVLTYVQCSKNAFLFVK
jgi:hypothetical protein